MKHCLILLVMFMYVAVSDDAVAEEERTLFAMPVAMYSTDTGFGAGAAAIKSYRTDLPRSSTLQFLTLFTTKKQLVAQAKIEHYLRGGTDRLLVQGGYKKFPSDFFGLGNATSVEDPERYTPEMLEIDMFYDYSIYRALKIRASFRLMHFAMIETDDGGLLEGDSIPWARGRFDAGPGIGVVWDNRDNTVAATQGLFLKLHYEGMFLQDDGDAWNGTAFELRYFKSLLEDLVLATQCRIIDRQGGVPFYMMTSLGGEEFLRGFDSRRFIGNSSALFQQDVRFPLFWRIGGAAFIATGKVGAKPGDLLEGRYHTAYGIGGRFFLNREEHLVLRADMAWSGDSDGFYITFAEAF